ncbi:MAG: ribonuclease H-like domain-containing protein [Polyangiales bacterium]
MKLRDKLGRLDMGMRPPVPPITTPMPTVEASAPQEPTRLDMLSSLRAQLSSLQQRTRPRERVQIATAPVQRPGRSFSEALLDEHDRMPAREVVVPGERVETPRGPLYQTVVWHDLEHRHGGSEVVRAARVQASEVALLALDAQLAGCELARALYIDTETTGLAGGSGTLPFLIGMAWFEDERLCVEQLLLPKPGLEGPMLTRLAERIARASTIVSYNGKSFDWPLLRTRFVLNRLAVPALPPHLDLLHCARRVYKARLGSVRLVHLEQELLGHERIDDLPGELIPQRYFEFMRGQADGSTLKPILDHNRHDLIALPALLGELARRFALDPSARQHACDQLAFARVAARAQERDRAIAHAQAVLEADVRGDFSAHAHLLVGELELKRGAIEKAVASFEAAVASGQDLERARAHLALAKLHEHKTKLLERALAHAACTLACEGEDARNRRMTRLSSRIQRRANSCS